MIFVVGFPKAGTSSLHASLNTAGFKSAHWAISKLDKITLIRNGKFVHHVGIFMQQAKEEGIPLLTYLPGFNAFTQMDCSESEGVCYWPQLTDVPLLDKQYPNSKFILNVRPIHKWISSVNRWLAEVNGNADMRERLTKLEIPGLPAGVGDKDEDLVRWHDWHQKNMMNYFSGSYNKFIVFDIEKDDPKRLGKFLDIKNFVWTHKNENKRIKNDPRANSSNLSPAVS